MGFERSVESHKEWYEKACGRLESFLQELDPDLSVEVQASIIHPTKGESHEGWDLRFRHATDQKLEWTMQIQESDDYIENRLEEVVKKIYLTRRREQGKKPPLRVAN
jgi:hypothetical protein